MTIQLSLSEWKAGDAASISGVSPELQRQWRRLGVLTPLTETKKTRFNIISIGFVVAARALISNGAGHKEISRLINELGGQIMYHAILMGRVRARPPVSATDVKDALLAWGAPSLSHNMKRRYFAFRNDEPSVGSNHRAVSFDQLETLRRWLETGTEQSEYDDDVDAFTGARIVRPELTPDEIAAEEEWRVNNPPSPALPRGQAAVVLDVAQIAEQLVGAFGEIYGEVWDAEEDSYTTGIRSLSAQSRKILDKIENITGTKDLVAAQERRAQLRVTLRDIREQPTKEVYEELALLDAAINRLLIDQEQNLSELDHLFSSHKELSRRIKLEVASERQRDPSCFPSYRVGSLLFDGMPDSDGNYGSVASYESA
jgi:hypothetical protein